MIGIIRVLFWICWLVIIIAIGVMRVVYTAIRLLTYILVGIIRNRKVKARLKEQIGYRKQELRYEYE